MKDQIPTHQLPPAWERRPDALPTEERTYLIAAAAATHDLLVMSHRPDLAPEFIPARTAMRARPGGP